VLGSSASLSWTSMRLPLIAKTATAKGEGEGEATIAQGEVCCRGVAKEEWSIDL